MGETVESHWLTSATNRLRFSETGDPSCCTWLACLRPGHSPRGPFLALPASRPPEGLLGLVVLSLVAADETLFFFFCLDCYSPASCSSLANRQVSLMFQVNTEIWWRTRRMLGRRGSWVLSLPRTTFMSVVTCTFTVLLPPHILYYRTVYGLCFRKCSVTLAAASCTLFTESLDCIISSGA